MTTSSAETTNQAVFDAIVNRQSAAKIGPERPPRELIERLLDAAVRAPNHYLNQPWRFVVLAGAARERFGDFLAQWITKKQADPTTPQAKSAIDRERRK